tara:strand:- start:526 stop:726 length:201 start_codon:yes stop_codon:yes gene_type:complete
VKFTIRETKYMKNQHHSLAPLTMNEKEIKKEALKRIRTNYYSRAWKEKQLDPIEQPPGPVCLLADG